MIQTDGIIRSKGMFERISRRLLDLPGIKTPERSERTPYTQRSARALYNSLEYRLTSDENGRIVTNDYTYAVFKYIESGTGNNRFSIIQQSLGGQSSNEKVPQVFYALHRGGRRKIVIRKNQYVPTSADDAIHADDASDLTVEELAIKLVDRGAESMLESHRENVMMEKAQVYLL